MYENKFYIQINVYKFIYTNSYIQNCIKKRIYIHSLRVGWRNIFSSCAVVSDYWFLAGNRFWCYLIRYLEYNTYSCGSVCVFWFWREIVFGVTYVLSVQYTCAGVSVFWLWWEIVLLREIVLKMRTPFDFLWAVSTEKKIMAKQSFEFLHGVHPVGDDCMDVQPYSHDCSSKILRTFFASRN